MRWQAWPEQIIHRGIDHCKLSDVTGLEIQHLGQKGTGHRNDRTARLKQLELAIRDGFSSAET